jgi:hypothetical protein
VSENVELLSRIYERFNEGELRFEPQAYDELDERVVIARTRWMGRGVASGAPVDAPVWHVWTIEDGLVTSLGVHASERGARAVASTQAS